MKGLKRCPRCRQSKPLSEFYRNRAAPSGHASHCKVCDRAIGAARRKNRIARLGIDAVRAEERASVRLHRERRPEHARAVQSDYTRAQHMATVTLRHNHPDEWALLLAAARLKVKIERDATD